MKHFKAMEYDACFWKHGVGNDKGTHLEMKNCPSVSFTFLTRIPCTIQVMHGARVNKGGERDGKSLITNAVPYPCQHTPNITTKIEPTTYVAMYLRKHLGEAIETKMQNVRGGFTTGRETP